MYLKKFLENVQAGNLDINFPLLVSTTVANIYHVPGS